MLATNPRKRPDIEQILRKSFVQTRVKEFVGDLDTDELHRQVWTTLLKPPMPFATNVVRIVSLEKVVMLHLTTLTKSASPNRELLNVIHEGFSSKRGAPLLHVRGCSSTEAEA